MKNFTSKEIKELMDEIEQRIWEVNDAIKSTNDKPTQLLNAVVLNSLVDLYIRKNELYIKAVEYETKFRTNKLLNECAAVLYSVTE